MAKLFNINSLVKDENIFSLGCFAKGSEICMAHRRYNISEIFPNSAKEQINPKYKTETPLPTLLVLAVGIMESVQNKSLSKPKSRYFGL